MIASTGKSGAGTIRLFLAGDVMLGRGVDQILQHPSGPILYEGYMTSAADYVRLAEKRHGPMPRAVPHDYVWGKLINDLNQRVPDVRIINLETSVTTSDAAEPKGINYRMHPANVGVLTAARVDVCSLANNHAMDWGRSGLVETLDTLSAAGLKSVGAGRTSEEAAAPCILSVPGKTRVIVLAFGSGTSGVPQHWAAGPLTPGLNLLAHSLTEVVKETRRQVDPIRRPGDVVVVSVHWGGNWGYEIEPRQRALAKALIDQAAVDVVFGHSSHHPKGVEEYHGKLILFGCGDLINDYEGISGQEQYRGDLALGYVADISASDGALQSLEMLPYRIRAFQLQHADADEIAWLAEVLDRECRALGAGVSRTSKGTLCLSWG